MKRIWQLFAFVIVIASCNKNKNTFDASGTFEADEVLISSETNGRILQLNINEGDTVEKGKIIAIIDSSNLTLQKQQVEASISSLKDKTIDVAPQIQLLTDQIAVQKAQLAGLERERTRTENLIKADAAMPKQLDDINTQIDVLKKQINVTNQQIKVQQTNTATQNKSILSEQPSLQKRVAQLQDQLQRSNIINPLTGTVLTKYAEPGEITTTGKALYKIADLSMLKLRAYITGDQLSQVKLNQQVKVMIDSGSSNYKTYTGIISWISDKAEFTPKTIQTKDERANLVYAVKINVKNDGYLKIGMYGEVMLNNK